MVLQSNCQSTCLDEIPDELQATPQWVLWRAEAKPDGGTTKVPYCPNGSRASVSDPRTWSTYEEVLACAANFSGIGFVNSPDSPWTFLDIDRALTESGGPKPSTAELLQRFETYTEVSPSGRGVRIILKGRIKTSGTDILESPDGAKVEIFHGAHYFTLTGNVLQGRGSIEDCKCQLEAFLCEFEKSEEKSKEPSASAEAKIPMTRALDIARRFRDPDNYTHWIELGQILKASYGDDDRAFDAWDEWSRISRKYPGKEELRKKWRSFKRTDKTVGSLVHLEREMQKANILRVFPGGLSIKGGGNLDERTHQQQQTCAPKAKRLGELRRLEENSEAELLKDSYLKRGGGVVINGNTGSGKSTFLMQALMCWAIGRDCFGISPAKPLRSLSVQAENDEAEISEMRDGVLQHLELSAPERDLVLDRVGVDFESGKSGPQPFREYLHAVLTENPCDILVIDPALAFLGGESNSQKDVSAFLRNTIDPILKTFNIGAVLAQHTAKPSRGGPEKNGWEGSEFSYASLGSVEWANWPRAVLFLRSIGFDDIYQLMAPKRGNRLGWKDSNGNATTSRYIVQNRSVKGHDGRPIIFWRDADSLDLQRIAKKSQAQQTGTADDRESLILVILPFVEEKPRSKKEFTALCKEHLNIGRDKADALRAILISEHGLEEDVMPGRYGEKYIGYREALMELKAQWSKENAEGS